MSDSENTDVVRVPLCDRLTLTLREAAELSGIPVKILRANARCRLLPTFTAGSTTMRVKRSDLDDWINTLPYM